MSSGVIAVKIKDRPTIAVNQSSQIVRNLDSLIDVDTSNKTDGSVLVYDALEEKFLATTTLEKQIVDGGTF